MIPVNCTSKCNSQKISRGLIIGIQIEHEVNAGLHEIMKELNSFPTETLDGDVAHNLIRGQTHIFNFHHQTRASTDRQILARSATERQSQIREVPASGNEMRLSVAVSIRKFDEKNLSR